MGGYRVKSLLSNLTCQTPKFTCPSLVCLSPTRIPRLEICTLLPIFISGFYPGLSEGEASCSRLSALTVALPML